MRPLGLGMREDADKQHQVNVYGVVNGKSNKLLVCRLSPGFHQLKTGTAPLASARGIAACSDGDSKGTLFFTM